MLAYYLLFQISLFVQFYFPLSARYFPPPAFLSLSSVSQISSFLSVPHFFTCLAMGNKSSKAFQEIVPQSASSCSKAFEEIVPQSVSASASSSKPREPFDVFINHRGPDSKDTLATSIHKALKPMGLKVFLDKPELDLGDLIPAEIEYAMTTSFLHIAILSPKYAESPWCLAELSFMFKTGKTIIPVFYNVEIGDFRRGKGIYTAAFSKYEASRRYSSEKLEEWRTALQKVTYLNGHIVKENGDEGEVELLKAIEEYVKKHSQKLSLVVANHPVGLDEIVQDFESSAFGSSEDVKIVGIVGMGGCGKTTLAKEYYNRKRYSICKCSFISNVKDVSKKDLHNMQKKMLEDLGFSGEKIYNVESGKAIIAECLRLVQVFIILDDVNSQYQLESLLPIKDSLGHDSIIIVTSRNSHILTSWGISISSIYKMAKLNPEHAMSLFCCHAFPKASLMDEFESRVQKFLKVCGGLPLSLKVLGGLVREKPQEFWDDQLRKISRLLPEDIESILKVSFDALDDQEKEMFLDISCWADREWDKQLAVTVWDGSGWNGLSGLTGLENKCLVEFDETNCITMHDHLRDLGKQIVLRKEIAKSPYRLWSPEQFDDIEMEGQKSVLNRGVRGIIAETEDTYKQCMELVERIGSRKWFKRRLEILFVRGNYFTEELATLSAGLVWLRWFDFPHTALPSWLSLKKLRILELRYAGELEQLWSETADPPVELRELSIYGATCLVGIRSSVGRLQHLKKVCLDALFPWTSAEEFCIPEEFCLLKSLEHLQIRGFETLRSLPTKFGDLINLRHLDLSHCSELKELPVSFKRLIHLQCINLTCCSKLNFPPDILENMRKLETLDLEACGELKELPQLITNQGSLKKLDLNDTEFMQLPDSIGELSKLEELRIGCRLLTTLPASIGNLSSLTKLQILRCRKLESLPEAPVQLTNLQSLDITDCQFLRGLSILSWIFSSSLCSLKRLSLCLVTSVTSISISQQCCPSLEYLRLLHNDDLVEIDSLPKSVKILEVERCPNLKRISRNCILVDLESLVIRDCWEGLVELPNFAESVSLQELEISRCGPQLKKIEGLEYCRSLKTLSVDTCWEAPGIRSLENAERLRRIEVSAWNMWALEPCLQTIKEWPGECIICARTARGVEEVVKSLTSPALTLVDSCSRQRDVEYGRRTEKLTLECGQRGSSNEAAMLCFVINSSSNDTSLRLLDYGNAGFHVGKGKWLWIGVFTDDEDMVSEDKFELEKSFREKRSNSSDDEDMGMAVMGEKNSSDDDEEHSEYSNSSDEHSNSSDDEGHSNSSDDEEHSKHSNSSDDEDSSDDDEEHSDSSDDEEHSNSSDDEDMGMAVMGEKEKVMEAFYQLLHH